MPEHKKIPSRFKTEAEEREFWERNDSTEYVDWDRAREVQMPNLERSTER